MDGSGISEQDGYTEETSVDVCMQLDTADCTKYQVYKLNPRERFLAPPPPTLLLSILFMTQMSTSLNKINILFYYFWVMLG